jgi:hypothetical protein
VIESLDVRYHTKSDGITYDLLKGQAVCVFDIDDPYDIADNTDLETVTAQQRLLDEKSSKSDSDEYYLGILNDFVNSSVSSGTTDICDGYISLLNSYYPNVSQDSQKAEILNSIMGRLDATRRAAVYETISDKLSDLLDDAALTNQSNKDIQQNTDVTDAITTAMQNVQSSLSKYEQEKINDESIVGDSSDSSSTGNGTGSGTGNSQNGETTNSTADSQTSESTLSKAENELIKQMIAAVGSGDVDSINSAFDKISALNNIENGTTGNAKAEAEYIKENLLKESLNKAKELMGAGVNADYVAALSNGSSKTKLTELLKQQSSEIEQALEEVLYFFKAAASRMTAAEAEEYLLEEYSNADSYMDNVQDDALKPYIQKLIDNYKFYIQNKALDYASGGTSELDNLISEVQRSITEKQKCLDTNDLEGAKIYDERIEMLENSIQAKERELTEIINSSTATDAQKADALAQLSSTTAAAAINDIKTQAMEDLSSGDYSTAADAVSGIEALVSVSPETAKAALKEIFTKLVSDQLMSDGLSSEDSSLISDAIDNINDVLADNSDVFLGNNMSQSAVLSLIEDYFGDSFYSLDNEKQTAAVLGIQEIGVYLNSSQLLETAAVLATRMYSSDNPYAFERLKNETMEYIPLENLAKCLNYRYVYSDSLKQATLQKGANYYYFDIFSKNVRREGDAASEMEAATKFQGSLYVPADYVRTTFNCGFYSVTESQYAIIYTGEIESLGTEFGDVLLYGIE